MNSSDNFGLNLPEQTDSYDVEHMNENTRAIDTLLNERMALKTITVNTDLNRMLESGIYYLPQNNTYTNMPPSCTNGWLIVMKNDGNVKQVFLRRGSASTHSNAYSRLLSGTGDLIGDWVRYLSELELGAFTNLDLDPQATDVVQALNDLYSYCVNQFAAKNHTHNYAGSSSAGGSATSAVKLQNARTIQTNLQSTSTASFDGTANITPGVTGTLPVANGGTGQTTLIDAEKALLTSLPTDTSSDMMDDHSFIPTLDQSGGGGMTWYTPRKRPFSRIWTYIQGKISSVLGLSTSGYTGNSASASELNLPSTKYGSQTQPVYFINGKPAACSFMIHKSVPSDAKFTDTTYSNATTSAAGLMSADDKIKLGKFYIQLLATYPPVSSFYFTLPNGTYLLTMRNLNYHFESCWFGILSVHNGYAFIQRINSYLISGVTISGTTITVEDKLDRAFAIKICD